jgi:hypothetical protein
VNIGNSYRLRLGLLNVLDFIQHQHLWLVVKQAPVFFLYHRLT